MRALFKRPTRRNAKPERLVQDAIEGWLKFQTHLVVMPIDNTARFDRRTASFQKKKQNQGALFYRGIPDILVICPERGIIGIEVKSDTGRQSPEQKDLEKAFKKANAKYMVVRSLDEVIDYFKTPDKGECI